MEGFGSNLFCNFFSQTNKQSWKYNLLCEANKNEMGSKIDPSSYHNLMSAHCRVRLTHGRTHISAGTQIQTPNKQDGSIWIFLFLGSGRKWRSIVNLYIHLYILKILHHTQEHFKHSAIFFHVILFQWQTVNTLLLLYAKIYEKYFPHWLERDSLWTVQRLRGPLIFYVSFTLLSNLSKNYMQQASGKSFHLCLWELKNGL